MFIETSQGRLQNLYLLQDVRVMENDKKSDSEELTYAVAYVQMNGVIIKEGAYATQEEAEAIRKDIVAKLVATGEE